MGGSQSIYQKSVFDTVTNISQKSRNQCLTSCVANNSNNQVIIEDSVAGNINFDTACFVQGASCTLKTSLDSDVLNKQKSNPTAEIDDGGIFLETSSESGLGISPLLVGGLGVFAAGALLGGAFSKKEINQQTYQSITNNVTQDMNSFCNNKSEAVKDGNIVYVSGSTVGDINLSAQSKTSNTQCILTNIAKTVVKNEQEFSPKAKIKSSGFLSGIMSIIIIVAIIFLLVVIFVPMLLRKIPASAVKGFSSGVDEGVKGARREIVEGTGAVSDLANDEGFKSRYRTRGGGGGGKQPIIIENKPVYNEKVIGSQTPSGYKQNPRPLRVAS